MKEETYSTYEAKARFSEILRKVHMKRRIVVTKRGIPVARIIPYEERPESCARRIRRLEEEGAIEPSILDPDSITNIGAKPGALHRFLSERD